MAHEYLEICDQFGPADFKPIRAHINKICFAVYEWATKCRQHARSIKSGESGGGDGVAVATSSAAEGHLPLWTEEQCEAILRLRIDMNNAVTNNAEMKETVRRLAALANIQIPGSAEVLAHTAGVRGHHPWHAAVNWYDRHQRHAGAACRPARQRLRRTAVST